MGTTVAAGAVAGCLTSDAESDPSNEAYHQGGYENESYESNSYLSIHEDAVSTEPAALASVKMITTDAGEHHFAPHVMWIEVGGTVTWELDGGAHTVTAYHPNNDRPLRIPDEANSFDSGRLVTTGSTFDHAFDVEGVYDYYCGLHEAHGMVGSILVGKPDVRRQPGMEPPQRRLNSKTHQRIVELNGLVEGILST